MGATFGQIIEGAPIRGLLLDSKRGHKRWGFACGKTLYDTNVNKEQMFVDPFVDPFPILPVIFMGRVVDIKPGGRKVYGIVSECNTQPFEGEASGDVQFVREDIWPPFGVTNVLKFSFNVGVSPLAGNCFDPPSVCPYIYLLWGGGNTWTGNFTLANGNTLTITLELTSTQDPDRPLVDGWPTRYKWEVTFSGCLTTPRTVHAHVSQYYPFRAGGQYGTAFPGAGTCCDSSSVAPDVGFRIDGYTNRMVMSRHVDTIGTAKRKVWLANECCVEIDECTFDDCCGCDASPFQYDLVVSGITNNTGTACDCHNGNWRLTLSSIDTLNQICTWSSDPGPCFAAPVSGMWTLRCDPTTGFVTLGTQHTPGGGGSATYRMNLSAWNCLGSNTLTLLSAPGTFCSNWPATLTVVPV